MHITTNLNVSQANRILRASIIRHYFEPAMLDAGFKESDVGHPVLDGGGLERSDLLHVFFDLDTGSDYPDGDEWFIVDLLFPSEARLPDRLKGPDYFTRLSADRDVAYWHHRELVRYKYGKSKKLSEALKFIESKYDELCGLLESLEIS